MNHAYATPALVAGIYLLLFALERLAPLRRLKHGMLRRLPVNAALSALAVATAAVTVGPIASFTLDLTGRAHWGLLHLISLPEGARLCLGVALMDLSFYYWHRANHRIPFLWRFHNVHHIDPDLDVTTALRFHIGEVALSSLFRVVQISVIGPPVWMFLLYEACFQINTVFQHSNIRLPLAVERRLNMLIVTPRMHGVHHSQVYNETNSNYSVIFPWWDRLHGTLRLNVPQSRIRIGIAAYSQAGDNTLGRALALPFTAQRLYWRTPEGRPVEGRPAPLPGPVGRMAE